MAADAFGIEIPADSDAFDPSGDMRDMGASLHSRIVVPVVNTTARDALTVTAGQLVNRLDTGDLERWDGAAWRLITSQDRGPITVASSWTPAGDRPLEWIQTGDTVTLFGSMSYNAGDLPSSGVVTPNGIPPVARRWDGSLRSGNGSILIAGLTSAGRIEWDARLGSGSSFLALDGIIYRASS